MINFIPQNVINRQKKTRTVTLRLLHIIEHEVV